jgi:exodeoxyribonuclease V alpha subunit
VGDPFQLASIEAGTVMSDVVGPFGDAEVPASGADAPLHGRITVLTRMRRFDEASTIAAVADAVRRGDADGVIALLTLRGSDVEWVRPDDDGALDEVLREVVADAVATVSAARKGDAAGALAAVERIKVLAATRGGPLGMDDWTTRVEGRVAQELDGFYPARRWQPGRPVLVTANDRLNRVFNGDTGVVVRFDGGVEVALRNGDDVRYMAPSRLDRVETWWAMTVHKSQGSEFAHAVVSLPQAGSPILTRELLYTAVTRARERLTIVGSEAALRAAIHRPVARASGLGDRLWPS